MAIASTAPTTGQPLEAVQTTAGPTVRMSAAASTPIAGTPTFGTPDPVTGAVTGQVNASDTANKKLSYAVTTAPAIGTVTINKTTGVFTYTPTAAQRMAAVSGADTMGFTVTISDGSTKTAQQINAPISPTYMSSFTTVTIGRNAKAVAVSNSRAYVTNSADGTVTVIDTIRRTVLATINVGGEPVGAALSPNGARLYVANYGANTVQVVDTSTNTVVNTIGETLGNVPTGIMLSPNGKTAYVINGGSNTVTKINTATNKIIGTVTGLGNGPRIAAISSDGKNIYVANAIDGTLSYFSSGATKATTLAGVSLSQAGTYFSSSLVFSRDNAVLYATTAGGQIDVINTKTHTLQNVLSAAPGTAPMSLTLNRDGSVLLAAEPYGAVTAIDTVTGAIITTLYRANATDVRTAAQTVLSPDGQQLYIVDPDSRAFRSVSLVPPDTFPTANPSVTAPTTTGVVFGQVNANDSDGDALKYGVATLPAQGAVKVNADGTFTYTPTATARHNIASDTITLDADRIDQFSVTVDDGRRGIITVPITVAIAPANNAPVVKSSAGTPNSSTGVVKGKVSATDKDKDALSYSATTVADNIGTVTIDAKGNFAFTPTAAARHGAATGVAADKVSEVTVTVNDGHGGITTTDVAVKISPNNNAPVQTAPTVNQPNPYSGVVTGQLNLTDTDGDALTYLISSATTKSGKGTVMVGGTGAFAYTPTDAARIAAGRTGASTATKSDSFTITTTDGHGGTVTTKITVPITPLSVFTTGGMTIAKSIQLPVQAPNYSVSSDTGHVYVLGGDSANVYTFTSSYPDGVESNAFNNLTIANKTTGVTQVLGMPTGILENFTTTPSSGNIYVTTGSSAGNDTLTIATKPGDNAPYTIRNIALGRTSYGVVGDIAVSPDGTKAYIPYYSGTDSEGNANVAIYVANTSNSSVGTIYNFANSVAPGSNLGVAVSPDGTRVYQTTYRYSSTGTTTLAVTMVNSNLTTATVPVNNNVEQQNSRISLNASGTLLSLITTQYSTTTKLFSDYVTTLDTSSNAIRSIPIGSSTSYQHFTFTVSPDGSHTYLLGYINNNASATATLTAVDNTTGTTLHVPLGTVNIDSVLNDTPPVMSPDGQHVYAIASTFNKTTGQNTNKLVVLDTASNAVHAIALPSGFTTDTVAVDNSNAYVTVGVKQGAGYVDHLVDVSIPIGL